MPNERAAARSWWLKVVTLVALGIWLYFPTLSGMVRQWYADPNYSHGFLVPVVSTWAIWRDRANLCALVPKPSLWGLVILVLALGTLAIGVMGAELFLMRVSLLLVLAGTVVFLTGWKYFRSVVFPWAFLVFMIPVPSILLTQITFPLQVLASNVAAAVLQILGIPVLRDGNIINLPTISLEVAQACSGIRSLLSLLTLAVAYGYLSNSRNLVRWIVALASVPVAVAANSFRIVITGLLAHYSGATAALGFFHEFSGLLIFIVSLAGLLILNRVLRRTGGLSCVH